MRAGWRVLLVLLLSVWGSAMVVSGVPRGRRAGGQHPRGSAHRRGSAAATAACGHGSRGNFAVRAAGVGEWERSGAPAALSRFHGFPPFFYLIIVIALIIIS